MDFINRLQAAVKARPRRVLFVDGEDERVLKAGRYFKNNNLADVVLIGSTFEIRDKADKYNLKVKDFQLIDPRQARFLNPLLDNPQIKTLFSGLKKVELGSLLKGRLHFALAWLAVHSDDIALCGLNKTISQNLSGILSFPNYEPSNKRISSYYLLWNREKDQLIIFADCTVNINPQHEHLAEIARLAAKQYHIVTKTQPKVAFLSFSTMASASHQNVEKVQKAVAIFKKNYPGITADGEFQFDAALLPQVALKKAAHASLQGNANVFIFPSLSAANIAQKMAEHLGNYISFGPVLMNCRKDIHLLPQACSADHIIHNVLLASFLKNCQPN